MIAAGSTPLVGRDEELHALLALAERARHGEGCLVLVHGEAGIGKSRLCRELAAATPGALRLRGQAYQGDATVAHAIVVDTLRGARREPGSTVWDAVQRRAPEMAAVLPELLEAGGEARIEDERHLFETVLDVVLDAAGGRPVLWIGEDVQWADRASWSFLQYCARRAARLPLLLVLTYRDDEPAPDDPSWANLSVLGERDRTVRIPLRRLAPEVTAEMARRLAGPAADEAALAGVVQRSGGTPLLVEELVSLGLNVEGRRGEQVPDVVRATARERARRAGPAARQLLELAAVTGHDADLDLLLDLRPDQAPAVEALVEAGLFHPSVRSPAAGAVEFRHPLLREAVYADIPWERRRLLHAEAAAALGDHASAQSVERIARHWELAGDPRAALDALLTVADISRRRGNPSRVATVELLALRLVDRHRALAEFRPELLDRAVDDLLAEGRWEDLLPLARERWASADALSPARRLRLAAVLGLTQWNLGTRIPDVRRFVDEELARCPDQDEPAAALLCVLGSQTAFMDCDIEQSRRLAVRARRAAELSGDVVVEVRARIAELWTDLLTGTSRTRCLAALAEIVERARAAGLPGVEASALLQYARVTVDEADIERVAAAARRANAWIGLGAQVLRGFVAVFGGRVDEATALFDDALSRVDEGSQAAVITSIGVAMLALMRGRLDDARSAIAAVEVGSWRDTPMLEPDCSALRAWLAWETEGYEEAAGRFGQALAALPVARMEPGLGGPYFIALYVDALVQTGRAEEAAQVLAGQAPREDPPDADRYTRAAFAASRLRLDPSPATAAEAHCACVQAGWPWLDGLVQLWTGEALGDRTALAEARDTWRGIGYESGAARAEAALRLAPESVPAAAGRGLTRQERRVADLLAEGLSNADIAERLGISPVTVAHHVSSIIGKLDLRSRTQVALRMAGDRGTRST